MTHIEVSFYGKYPNLLCSNPSSNNKTILNWLSLIRKHKDGLHKNMERKYKVIQEHTEWDSFTEIEYIQKGWSISILSWIINVLFLS